MAIRIVRKGMLIVVSSPSGGGKSTVIKSILEMEDNLDYSVSVTTRPMRPGDVDGKSYSFVTEEQFHQWVEEGRFYEWAHVHGHLYGTRKDVIHEKRTRGLDIVMDLDFQGGLNVKKQSPDALLVFLLPPSMSVLEKRLRSRKTDSEKTISLRLKNAREEMKYASRYDYALINNDLRETIENVRNIICAERHRTSRMEIINEED